MAFAASPTCSWHEAAHVVAAHCACSLGGACARVEMGNAVLHAHSLPPHALLPELAPEILLACGAATTCSTVDIGNPHLVLHCEQLPTDAALARLGPRIEHHRAFPHRTNVQFAVAERTPAGSSFERVRTWERGSGITQACGTGACAVAASLAGSAPASLDIALPGGMLTIDTGIASSGGGAIVPDVCMTGPAAFVFEGVLPILHTALAS
jgi:diaminopimelate epimerase